MDKSEFNRMCREWGDGKRKSTYVRCIGDGILQTISTSPFRIYISPFSPYYSKNRRKSNYISIGLWSMYCPLPEILFDPQNSFGQFTTENFRGKKFLNFNGIEDDYIFMIEKGFSILDSIKTQKKLIEITQFLYTAEFGGVGPAQIDLCEPYLKCGQLVEALERVGSYYASRWAMFHETADEISAEEYSAKEKELRLDTHEIAVLWSMIATRDKDRIEDYLKSNYIKNVGYAKKYGIPIELSGK